MMRRGNSMFAASPPMTAMGSGFCLWAPRPMPHARGRGPRVVARPGIMIGPERAPAAARGAPPQLDRGAGGDGPLRDRRGDVPGHAAEAPPPDLRGDVDPRLLVLPPQLVQAPRLLDAGHLAKGDHVARGGGDGDLVQRAPV